MYRLFILGLFLAGSYLHVYGQESHIRVTGRELPGDTVRFFTYREPLFNIKYPVARAAVTDPGTFNLDVSVSHTECIYTVDGPFLGYVFIRPGHSYHVDLPVLSGLSDDWKHNPFFNRALLHLRAGCEDCQTDSLEELNHVIKAFDSRFEPFRNKQLLRYYSPEYSRSKLDSFILANPVPTGLGDSTYFWRYRFYKMGILEFSVNAFNTDTLIAEYFVNRRVDFSLPPYRELFRMVFDHYYQHLARKDAFHDVYKIFNRGSVSELHDYLHADPVMQNDTLFQTVLLNEIYESYYSGDFPKDRMRAFADSVRANSEIMITRDMATVLLKKFTKLQPGQPAPDFHLKDVDGHEHSLDEYKGKYVCLGFCDMQSMSCLREFEYLKAIAARHSDYLSVITIIPSENAASVKQFVDENRISWTVLVAPSSGAVFTAYDVKGFPLFFLIDKQGLLVKSPAVNPSAGFEDVLFRIMKQRGDI
ncbi:MAG TPA: TlpA disulfide reductase family protein [Bacteroidales bacterium]|nr:TlpA disulfide reductase family protein [Bacteroidales bacterium]